MDERGASGEQRAPRPLREASPARPIPPQRRRRVLPPEYTDVPPPRSTGPDDESAWRRERREEAEFRAQFGEWRPGRASSRPFLGGVRLGAPLIVLIAVLVAVVALALHL